MNLWWRDDPRERFWLESTDRADLGADLRSVLQDAKLRENWRHTLFRHAAPGDVVFHYDKRRQAIVRRSRLAGAPEPIELPWRGRSTSAARRGAQMEIQAGYRIALTDGHDLAEPVTLAALRAARSDLERAYAALRSRVRGGLYLPFELSGRPVRLLQGYAFKLPAETLAIFPQLAEGLDTPAPSTVTTPEVEPRWSEGATAKPGRWASVHRPAVDVELWLRHNALQEALYDELAAAHGAENVRLEVPIATGWIDLVMRVDEGFWYYEVKTAATARGCIREALGQLLDYALAATAPPKRLFVAGPAPLTPGDEEFLNRLKALLSIPLDYVYVAAPVDGLPLTGPARSHDDHG